MSMPGISRVEGKTYSCRVDIIDDLVPWEETKEIIVTLESVYGGKYMLKVNRIIRIRGIISIDGILWCIHWTLIIGSRHPNRQESDTFLHLQEDPYIPDDPFR